MPSPSTHSEFRRAFLSVASRVHRRQALRHAITGAGFGLALGALSAFGCWALRLGELRPFSVGLGALGAAAGAAFAGRRRWSDTEMALYLDARFGSHETLTTALAAQGQDDVALAHVVDRAESVLQQGDPTRARPKLWSRLQLVAPVSLVAITALSLMPLPRVLSQAAPLGLTRVQVGDLKGLEKIEALARVPGQNPEQDARLKSLSEQAKRLRQDLAKGLARREALSEIAKLRDGVEAERLKFGDAQNRAGLDAAIGAFGSNQALQRAREALGNGDLTAFDREMQQLANRAESSDRKAASEALAEAARAARDKGARGLAQALDAQKQLFERRQARADALRELAQGLKGKLSPEALEDLKEFGERGSAEAAERLERGLERALQGLSADERKRLAERLQEQLEQAPGAASPMTKQQIEQLAKQLASDAGTDALEQQLRELAKPEASGDAQREQGLSDAERGGSAAARGLGAMPLPMDGPGAASDPAPASSGAGTAPSGSGTSGGRSDRTAADHSGTTPRIAGNELRAKAEAHLRGAEAMHGATLGRAPARAGETANQLGTGTLGEARQTEVGAVDHADIPEEYREQVGRYFEP